MGRYYDQFVIRGARGWIRSWHPFGAEARLEKRPSWSATLEPRDGARAVEVEIQFDYIDENRKWSFGKVHRTVYITGTPEVSPGSDLVYLCSVDRSNYYMQLPH